MFSLNIKKSPVHFYVCDVKSFNKIYKSKLFIQALGVACWELYLALFVSKNNPRP